MLRFSKKISAQLHVYICEPTCHNYKCKSGIQMYKWPLLQKESLLDQIQYQPN